jgi:lactoylglutathione lyase
MRLEQVRLLVADFPAAFRFYRDVLGLEPNFGAEGDSYASFATGTESGLALFDGAEMAEAVGTRSLPASAARRDPFVLVLEVADVDAAAARVVAAGTTLVTQPTDHPDWGIRTCHLRDPEGNLIELEQPLPPVG